MNTFDPEPDHRWRRMLELFNADIRLRRSFSDGWIRAGLAWLRGRRDGRIPADGRPDPFADIRAAHELRFGDDDRRSVVDAGLLAGAEPAAIAARTGMPASAVAAYAALFMDIAGRLKSAGYITLQFLRVGSDPIRDPAVVRRAIGYFEGWDALGRHLDTGELSPEMREYVEADSTRHRVWRAWLAVEAMEVHPGNAARAARLVAMEAGGYGGPAPAGAGRSFRWGDVPAPEATAPGEPADANGQAA